MRYPSPLLMVSSAAMELSWMGAWALFTSVLVTGQAFPFSMALGPFALAAIATAWLSRTRWRGWAQYLANVLACAAVVAVILWIPQYWSVGFLDRSRLLPMLIRSAVYYKWLVVLFLSAWIVGLWIAGVLWSRRPGDHQTLCNRFDIGLALLVLLFLFKWLAVNQLGPGVQSRLYTILVGGFFFSGLFSVGVAKNQDTRSGVFLGGHRFVGLLLVFLVVIFIVGVSTAVFFIPHSQQAATHGYEVLRGAATPLMRWVVAWLIRLFKPSADQMDRMQSRDDSGNGMADHLSDAAADSAYQTQFMHGIGVIYTVAALIAAVYVIRCLYRWVTRNRGASAGKTGTDLGPRVLGFVLQWFLFLAERIRQLRQPTTVAGYFAGLIRWGTHGGVVHQRNETPSEYAARLIKCFPGLADDVLFMVSRYNDAIYGGIPASDTVLAQLRAARTSLLHPRFWPARMRSWANRW